MTTPSEPQTVAASMSAPAVFESAAPVPSPAPSAPAAPAPPSAPVDPMVARLDAEMARAEAAAWAEASPEAQAEHQRAATAAEHSLVHAAPDQLEAWLSDAEAAGELGATAQADLERETGAELASELDDETDAADDITEGADNAADDAAVAREIVSQAEQELAYRQTLDNRVMSDLTELSGATIESNGKSRFENLQDRALRNQLSKDEEQELSEQTALRHLATPVAQTVQRATILNLGNSLWSGIQAAVKGGDVPADQANVVFTAGFERIGYLAMLGRQAELAQSSGAAPAAAARQTTQPTTRATAPARSRPPRTPPVEPRVNLHAHPPEGLQVEERGMASSGFLAAAFNPDGTPNEAFDAQVRAGLWLGKNLKDLAKS